MKKKNLVKIILFISSMLAIVIVVIYLIIRMFIAQNAVSEGVQDKAFSIRNIVVKTGETLSDDVSQYIYEQSNNTKQCILDTSKVDTLHEGTYEYSVICGKTVQKATVDVVRANYVEVKDIYLAVGEEIDKGLLIAYNNFDTFTIRLLTDKTSFDSPGEYPINFLIIKGEYVKEFSVTAHVYEKYKLEQLSMNDTEYAYNGYSNEIEIGEDNYYFKFDKALKNLDNVDNEPFSRLHEKLKNYENNKIEYVYLYNKYDYIIGMAIYIELESPSIYEPRYIFLSNEE